MNRKVLFTRTELLIGQAAMEELEKARVILFGLGGVGGWCAEGLIRSGLGHLTLVDSDGVCITNVNRQIQATSVNVGRVKVDELAQRLRSINPQAEIVTHHRLYGLETKDSFDIEKYDYVLDAIDSLSDKIGLIMHTLSHSRTLFSSMGASSKLDPTRVKIGSIWDSHGCPLARRIRKRLRRHGIKADFKVVYSEEMLVNQGESISCGTGNCHCPNWLTLPDGRREQAHEWCSKKAVINGSVVQVTATFGMFLSSLVVNDVIAKAGPAPLERGHQQVDPDKRKKRAPMPEGVEGKRDAFFEAFRTKK